ncbi:MAG: hypothetical protein AAF423_07250 [Pseudomonadota bacterium]
MKTNHQRGFVAKPHRFQGGFSTSARSLLADKSFFAGIGFCFTDGNRGMAKAKRGAKKFVRSRIRYHDKAALKEMQKRH